MCVCVSHTGRLVVQQGERERTREEEILIVHIFLSNSPTNTMPRLTCEPDCVSPTSKFETQVETNGRFFSSSSPYCRIVCAQTSSCNGNQARLASVEAAKIVRATCQYQGDPTHKHHAVISASSHQASSSHIELHRAISRSSRPSIDSIL